MAPFYGWDSTASRLQSHCEALQSHGTLLFTAKEYSYISVEGYGKKNTKLNTKYQIITNTNINT